jgi:hypothetical protein
MANEPGSTDAGRRESQKSIPGAEVQVKPPEGPGHHVWIPLYQTIAWPAVVLVFLLVFRKPLNALLHYLAERVREGSSVEFAGIKMGAATRPQELKDAGQDPTRPASLPNTIYMMHRTSRDPSLDRDGLQYHRIRISLDADTPHLLDEVERVVYHLHPTFRNPERQSENRDERFEITTVAWGEFNMTADVYLRDRGAPLIIERYINFH